MEASAVDRMSVRLSKLSVMEVFCLLGTIICHHWSLSLGKAGN